MNSISLPLLSMLLLTAGTAAQVGVGGIVLDNVRQKFVLVQPVDGQLWGMGAEYTTRFLADRVSFAPNLPESPVDPTVLLRARAFGRGKDLAPLPMPSAPVADGLSVLYRRGSVVETYSMRPESMEQSFVFHELPAGDGDLVVEVQIDTALPLQAASDQELVFGGELDRVRIDTVVGIDANGDRVAGRLDYAAGVMTLRLPGDFVRRAALPLVLDPLITSQTPLTTTNSRDAIDAAYDATTGTWMAVWRQLNTPSGTSPYSVVGWLEPGGAVLIDPSGTQTDPVVANCNARDAFVVAWTESDGVYVRALQSASLLGQPRRINPTVGPTYASLGLASNARTNDDRMLLANQMTSGGVARANLLSFAVAPNLLIGSISNGNASASGGIYGQVGPVAIASSGGANGEYLVSWRQQVGPNVALLSRLFGSTGNPLGGEVGVGMPGTGLEEIAIDGQDGRWIAAFNSRIANFPYFPFTYLMGIDRAANGALVARDQVLIEGDKGAFNLDVALAGNRVVMSFVRVLILGCTSTSGQCISARVGTYTLSSCLPCQASEEYYTVYPLRTALVRPAASGDTANPELVRGYTSTQVRLTLDNQVGLVNDLGGGCGGLNVRARAECAKTGGNFEAVLESTQGNSWLLLGTARADLRGCGTCVLVPDPYTSMVAGPLQRNAFDLTSFTIAVPAVPSLIGTRFWQQWLVDNPQTPGCTSFPFSFSNALQVQIQ